MQPERKPAYHLNKDCQLLHSDWVNVIIPKSVRYKGDEAIDYYRSFFCNVKKDDKIVLTGRINALKAAFLNKYQLKLNDNDIINVIKSKNTSYSNIVNNTLNQQTTTVNNVLIDLLRFLKTLEKSNKGTIENQVYNMRFLDYEDIRYLSAEKDERLKTLSNELANQKQSLFDELFIYLQIKYHFDQENIDKGLLDFLGFKPCSCVKPLELIF